MATRNLGAGRGAGGWPVRGAHRPPRRSALDFLDAPQRLGRFLDGRLLRMLVAPAKLGGRTGLKVLNASFGMVTGVVTKIIGSQLLRDVQTFVSAMDTMSGGFRERAEYTYRLLRAPGTAFLVVAAPEHDALREASYFVERLERDGMPLAGLVLNRVHRSPAARLSAARSLAAAELLQGLEDSESSALGIAALRLHAERMRQARSARRLARPLRAARPHGPPAQGLAQPHDVPHRTRPP